MATGRLRNATTFRGKGVNPILFFLGYTTSTKLFTLNMKKSAVIFGVHPFIGTWLYNMRTGMFQGEENATAPTLVAS